MVVSMFDLTLNRKPVPSGSFVREFGAKCTHETVRSAVTICQSGVCMGGVLEGQGKNSMRCVRNWVPSTGVVAPVNIPVNTSGTPENNKSFGPALFILTIYGF